MPESRREYLIHHRSARAWAALDHATNAQMKIAYDPSVIAQDSLKGKHIVVIGSGVGGLTTAYELLANHSGANLVIPFLEKTLSHRLQAPGEANGFSDEFKQALHAVYKTQAGKDETRLLRGWQPTKAYAWETPASILLLITDKWQSGNSMRLGDLASKRLERRCPSVHRSPFSVLGNYS